MAVTSLDINGYFFLKVKSSELNDENIKINEVNRRIVTANRAYFANRKFPRCTMGADTWKRD